MPVFPFEKLYPKHLLEKCDESPKGKKFNYSSDGNFYIIEQAVSDLASATNANTSEVIENILIDSLIPRNERARWYMIRVLLNSSKSPMADKYGFSLQEAIAGIAEDEIIAEQHPIYKGNQGRKVFEFTLDMMRRNTTTLISDKRRDPQGHKKDNMLHYWICISDVLENAAKEEVNILASRELLFGAGLVKEYASVMETDCFFRMSKTISLILENWDALGSNIVIWKFLDTAMDAIKPWEEQPADRNNFRDLCMYIFVEEDIPQANKSNSDPAYYSLNTFNYFELTDERELKVPSDWIAINPGNASRSRYAGVVHVNGFNDFTVPHFIIFSQDTPISELQKNDEEEIFSQIKTIWPLFSKVEESIQDEELTGDKPSVEIYSIFEEDFYKTVEAPFGAKIIKKKKGE